MKSSNVIIGNNNGVLVRDRVCDLPVLPKMQVPTFTGEGKE